MKGKKWIALLLVLSMGTLFMGCGGSDHSVDGNGSGSNTSSTGPTDNSSLGTLGESGGKGAWYNEDASGEDLFRRHGLSDVIPEKSTYIRRWMEDPWTDSFVRTSYTFEIPGEPTVEERAAYFNRILDQLRAAADDGKAYKYDYDFEAEKGSYVEMENYDAQAESWEYLTCSYYYEGKFWDVSCMDDEFDDYYVFELEINTSLAEDGNWP